MKFAILFISFSFLCVGGMSAQEAAGDVRSNACPCKDCKCNEQGDCGCLSGQGCSCNATRSCCGGCSGQ